MLVVFMGQTFFPSIEKNKRKKKANAFHDARDNILLYCITVSDIDWLYDEQKYTEILILLIAWQKYKEKSVILDSVKHTIAHKDEKKCVRFL